MRTLLGKAMNKASKAHLRDPTCTKFISLYIFIVQQQFFLLMPANVLIYPTEISEHMQACMHMQDSHMHRHKQQNSNIFVLILKIK